ncbi:MAG: hypothetical protein KA799_01350 [Bacteroidales bacterium]|jgi:hypothetical protein|nr:hypothetical protein [Bacteroidales bacterium]
MKTIEIIIEPMTDFCEAFNRAKALLMDDETPMSVKYDFNGFKCEVTKETDLYTLYNEYTYVLNL